MLRNNQQDNLYNLIDIIKYCNDLYYYIKNLFLKKVNKFAYTKKGMAEYIQINNNFDESKQIIKKVDIINGTGFLFTLFGNDFIPKMISIDVTRNFDDILNIYVDVLVLYFNYKFNASYYETKEELVLNGLVYYNNGKYNININMFFDICRKLKDVEYNIIERYSLIQKHDYGKLLNMFDMTNEKIYLKEEKVLDGMDIFFKKYDELQKNIKSLDNVEFRSYIKCFSDILKSYDDEKMIVIIGGEKIILIEGNPYDIIINKIDNDLLLKYYEYDDPSVIKASYDKIIINIIKESHPLINKLMYNISHVPTVKTGIYSLLFSKLNGKNAVLKDEKIFLILYISYYFEHMKFLKINFFLRDRTIDSEYQQKKFLQDVIIPHNELTEVDKKIFQFQNLLDEYIDLLDAKVINLCDYNLDADGTYKKCNIESEMKKYYEKYFKATDKNEIYKICSDYIDGILWTFNYYFNFHYHNQSSKWYYPHEKSPFITDMFNYMNNIKTQNDKLFKSEFISAKITDLLKYNIEFKKYMLPIHHTAYISTLNTKLDVKEKYRNELEKALKIAKSKNITSYEINIETIVDDIIKNNTSVQKYINCSGAIYLSKCVVNKMMESLPPIDIYLQELHKQ